MSQATLSSAPFRNSDLFSGYYLDERVDDLDPWDCDEQAAAAFDALQHLWELEGDLVDSYKEDELLDSWIDEVLDVLGFGTLSETTLPNGGGYNDRLLFHSDSERREAARQNKDGDTEGMYASAAALLEAKQWGADFTQRFNEQRSYRDASHQTKYYLERTPDRLQWGILTDGRKWRLYGTKDYATETYYEVDLPELLESGDLEAFKYFYVFFRPEAFRETAGASFLDTVWSESETAAQELGEDLQDNVFTALRVLGEGFVETNDLDIDPDDADALDELKEQSLVLLYRLMFVLYAESRGLIHPDSPDDRAEYEEHFSLDQLRLDVHEEVSGGDSLDDFSEHATTMWSRLRDLFRLVDSGEESLGIPPYNGGLFDDEEHAFLADHQVADRYVAEVVYRLGTTAAEDGSFVLADYADLDTRHLGSIYEGLLEHEFRIAPEQYAAVSEDGGQVWKPATEVSVADAVETVDAGELYVVNDDGERKATGAYYTPDYVVSYIVEETVDPLLDDIDDDLRADGLEPSDRAYFAQFWQEVLDLKVLDPAMGSGHFLTKATGYLTEQVMEVVREQEIQSYDEQQLRREIAKECIYGVDINGMAVELAKLSMWLETLAADQPLAFLDHHLKTGNSLVGSDITEVLSDDTEEEGGQLTLTQVAARARRQTLDHVMDLMEELLEIDNETLDDIKSMEEIYHEIRSDALYQRLFEISNVHTAEQFGVAVPEDAYEEMAGAIEDEDEWAAIRTEPWFTEAQSAAEREDFFHWELEYPEVFFDIDGEERDDAGFDAVVGNPPYAQIQLLPEQQRAFYDISYQSTYGSYDIYILFIEKGRNLLAPSGRFGYIIPNKLFRVDYGQGIREIISDREQVSGVVNFGANQVFPESATTYTALLFLTGSESEQFDYRELKENNDPESLGRDMDSEKWIKSTFENETLSETPWNFQRQEVKSIIEKVARKSINLGEITDAIGRGSSTGDDDIFEVEIKKTSDDMVVCRSESESESFQIERETLRIPIHSTDFEKYSYNGEDSNKRLIWPYDEDYELRSEADLNSNYPRLWDYLKRNRESLEQRSDYSRWYDYSAPRNLSIHDHGEIIIPLLADSPSFAEYPTPQSDYVLMASGGFSISLSESTDYSDKFILSLINSKLLFLCLQSISNVFRGGYITCTKQYFRQLPIRDFEYDPEFSEREEMVDKAIERYQSIISPETEADFAPVISVVRGDLTAEQLSLDVAHDILTYLAGEMTELNSTRNSLNTDIFDHLGSYEDGQTLADIGFTQPPKGAADSILQQTAEQKPNLRVGEATVERESDTTVEIRLTARYKPDDEDEHETDQWGYTETEPLPALRITDLTETEADLIAAFVPVAVDEAGGFAGFRETATKTNSLVDRLRALTLPRVADVADGLESYRETMDRAAELDRKIERTDDLIDEIVYELYGLTDEEIRIVEDAVGE